MPSTITTYYTFQPATKARASQVNTNFSNYRGDVLPINENTASASDNVHYLGGPDHYWAGAYFGQIDFRTSTTTATLILKGDTTNTTGAFLFQIEGVNKAQVLTDGLVLAGATTTANAKFEVSQSATTGAMDLKFGTSTITSWDNGGLQRRSLDVGYFTTGTAPIGGYVLTGFTTLASVAVNSLTGQTFTSNRINTRGGGIIRFQMHSGYVSRLSAVGDPMDKDFLVIDVYYGPTTTSLTLFYTYPIVTDYAWNGVSLTSFIAWGDINFMTYLTSYTAGEVVFQTIIHGFSSGYAYYGTYSFSCGAGVFIEEI